MRAAHALSHRSTFVVKLPHRLGGAGLTRAVEQLARQSGVTRVEPDRLVLATGAGPDDPYYGAQWNLQAPSAGQVGIDAPGAWSLTTGAAGVTVAVLDTGFTDHPDLAGRIVSGYDFVTNAAMANDGDGRDGDAHDPGDWITSAEDQSGYFQGCGVQASSWHGTHVAGIIGAITDNALGVAGINATSPILAVRVLGKCGGYTSDIVDGMRWAAGLDVPGVPANTHPARVLNLSLGGVGACDSTWQSAIDDVRAVGAVVVAAAGNDGDLAANTAPGDCAGVIDVAATWRSGNLGSYSNRGSAITVAAPGGDTVADPADGIWSTLNAGTTVPGSPTYARYEGTSMAAPQVTGVVSLMLSINPALTPDQIRSLLVNTATPFAPGSTCTTALCGAGIVDASRAVAAASPLQPPDAPSSVSVTAGTSAATMSWSPPVGDGGSAVSGYLVEQASASGPWIQRVSVDATTTSATVTGLINGLAYRWRVRAVNAVGAGVPSAVVSAMPTGPPEAPRALRATAGDGRAQLWWSAPSNDGGLAFSSYTVSESVDRVAWTPVATVAASVTTASVSGLRNGVTYWFTVDATNADGTGSPATLAPATPVAPLVAPAALDAQPGNAAVVVSWSPPASTGGQAVSRYVLQRTTPTGRWLTVASLRASARAYRFRALRNGVRYRFRIAARTVAGLGPWSDPVSAVPRTVPRPPRMLQLRAGAGAIWLSWKAPADDGGAPVTGYRIVASRDAGPWVIVDTIAGTLTNYVATALSGGHRYRFEVQAINASGAGVPAGPRRATPTLAH